MLLSNMWQLKATGWVCGLMVGVSVKSVSKLIFRHATRSFKQIRWWNAIEADQCVTSICPCLFFFFSSNLLKPKLPITAISANPLTTVYQLPKDSSSAVHARLGKPTLTTLTFRCDQPTRGFGKTPHPPLPPPPMWCLIVDLPVLFKFTFNFPHLADISMVTKADVVQGLGGAVCICIYVSGSPFMSLLINSWQSPNWISAYEKVGEGRGWQEDHGMKETQ